MLWVFGLMVGRTGQVMSRRVTIWSKRRVAKQSVCPMARHTKPLILISAPLSVLPRKTLIILLTIVAPAQGLAVLVPAKPAAAAPILPLNIS